MSSVVSNDEAAIWARGVGKSFTTSTSEPGFRGAVRGLLKPTRTTTQAIVDIDLTVSAGELVLLLGPNGAGKSTLIKVLTGVVRPSCGEVRIAGASPQADRRSHAQRIGTVFGQRSQLWWDLPVRQSFRILQHIYEIPEPLFRRRLAEFEDILGLSEFADTKMRNLSLGQRVRSDLAGALLHEPAVVFLDEPTIGMDVVAKEQVRRFLRREVDERGAAVLLTTHDMNEVKRLGSRVVVINHGRIVSDGDIGQLVTQFGGSFRIVVTLADPGASVSIPGLIVTEQDGALVTLAPARRGGNAGSAHEALAAVVQALRIDSVSIEQDDLEDVMRAAFTSVARDQSPTGNELDESGKATDEGVTAADTRRTARS